MKKYLTLLFLAFSIAVATQAQNAPGFIKVSKDQVILATREGKELHFENKLSEGPSWVRYRFVQYWSEIDYAMIEESHYEGKAYLLVNRGNGNLYKIPGPVLLSPDAQRVVSFSCDLEAGYNPNALEIWKIDRAKLVMEWSAKSPLKWGPMDVRWENGTTLTFSAATDYRSKGAPARLALTNGKWILKLPD